MTTIAVNSAWYKAKVKAIHDQNFTGKVVEVVSGDCVIVADDSIPFGSPQAERRVNLSSIRCPKMGNPRQDEKPAPYAHEAKEFLRTRLIGRQVNVQIECSRKVGLVDGSVISSGAADSRVMDFGSVFLLSYGKADSEDAPSLAVPASQPTVSNIAELIISNGFGTVIRHHDFEERSNFYDTLLAAESHAISERKGIHSAKDPPVMHITDLTTASAKRARDFPPFLHRSRRVPAVVEYVLSGHRFKLLIPKETCSIAFAFSGVRCPDREEPYSDEAIALIMQRDVEIEVETVDRTGTFLGSLWESRTNGAVALLEAGLAILQTSFGSDRIPDLHVLEQAEQSAKSKKLKIWENFAEGEVVPSGANVEAKQKEILKVTVTEVLGGGKFYVQTVGDQKIASIQNQLASLNLKEAPVIGAFNPKKGDIVLCYFRADTSWYRAMVVNTPRGPVESPKDVFEVFYIDYGNQEEVTYSQLRPLDPSVSAAPGLAQLCSLAYIKIPNLEEDFGQEAAEYLSELTLSSGKEFRVMVEERDTTGGKVKGQGTGAIIAVTLVVVDAEIIVNAVMLQLFGDMWHYRKSGKSFQKIRILFDQFHGIGTLPKSFSSYFVALIPKVNSPFSFSDFRPISLLGCLYKIIAKVLTARLAHVMDRLVAPTQSAFIKGRHLVDGVVVINEIVDSARRNGQSCLIFKVDFEKAYDSVDWSFLDYMLDRFGFCSKRKDWIRACVFAGSMSVLVNGSPSEEINIQRGLKQGGPLAPFLFLLVAEGLGGVMKKAVEMNQFRGFKVRDSDVVISRLQYADDTICVGEASINNLWALKAILRGFEMVSGLKVNYWKSSLMGVNVSHDFMTLASTFLNCKTSTIPFKYLGLPVGANPRRLSTWEPLLEALRKRLSAWGNKYVSLGGRIVLLNSVLNAIPVFYLSFLKLPVLVWKKIRRIQREFLWGGRRGRAKISWIKWHTVCLPKAKGGLGVRDVRMVNISLLAKWRWRLLDNNHG